MEEYSIYTYTIVHAATAEFVGKVPYCATILQGSDGTRFPALAEGYREGMQVKIGQRVYPLHGADVRYTLALNEN